MSINQEIIDALTPICSIVEQDEYEGNSIPFIVFTISENGGIYADDEAKTEVATVTIHYFVEKSTNYIADKNKIKKALVKNGFLHPAIEILYEHDTELRHIIFETEKEE